MHGDLQVFLIQNFLFKHLWNLIPFSYRSEHRLSLKANSFRIYDTIMSTFVAKFCVLHYSCKQFLNRSRLQESNQSTINRDLTLELDLLESSSSSTIWISFFHAYDPGTGKHDAPTNLVYVEMRLLVRFFSLRKLWTGESSWRTSFQAKFCPSLSIRTAVEAQSK